MSSVAPDSLELCSMDFWDYFVELECLQNSKGKDLQLAAELGKTLLERNKELETGLKQQQTVIDDQGQEIEYLSKQSTALREVNDSRLRVYEQLEVSIQELEVTNQRLQDELSQDKKRIRSLCQSVECLEARASELQGLVDELRAAERTRRAACLAEQQRTPPARRDSQSQSRADELVERVALLERQMSECRDRERVERERRQCAEAELAASHEECSELRQEMAALRERSVKLHTLAEEVHALEEQRLSPVPAPVLATSLQHLATDGSSVAGCRARPRSLCLGRPGCRPVAGGRRLGRLGRFGRRRRRAGLGAGVPHQRPGRPLPGAAGRDGQVRVPAVGAAGAAGHGPAPPLRDSGPDSLMLLAVASDGEASSSGFSEGSSAESRTVSRATQTPELPTAELAAPPPPPAPRKVTALFQHTPQYKQLFQEIFQVLKKPVVVAPTEAVPREVCVAAAPLEAPPPPPPPPASLDAAPPAEPHAGPAEPHGSGALPAGAMLGGPRTFSYTEEFERLKAREAACADGVAEAPPGGAPEEFPHLSRPSEEVAKLRLLERSYAEALKAGRRCRSRHTLL
ncbi:actin cytoskeleton-regulatory complex protein PAN1-like [Pollicipes pollicipes]|uniref:actin cytoskeleton-regulatory complex protein PAN1-like n=1 Tax=Pollicipes pollicipes TaxID=41117 RepID=UPI0018856BF1|nr:actin cytoskeleton-regulatory complex protein PAN1-like [Pollicipes pollicipes]